MIKKEDLKKDLFVIVKSEICPSSSRPAIVTYVRKKSFRLKYLDTFEETYLLTIFEMLPRMEICSLLKVLTILTSSITTIHSKEIELLKRRITKLKKN